MVCDSDYRGEYIVAMHNDTDELMVIEAGDRIAQLIIMPFIPVQFDVVDELSETERGDHADRASEASGCGRDRESVLLSCRCQNLLPGNRGRKQAESQAVRHHPSG